MDDTQTALRPPVSLPLAAALTLPGAYLGLAAYLGLPGLDLPDPALAVVYGLAILGAAFLLSWAAEAAQVDINAGLALAVLALVAVLPEYAVDFVFTAKCGGEISAIEAGEHPEVCSLSLANMTGANRVLVGVGWPLVVLIASLAVWWARKKGKEQTESASTRPGEVRLAPVMSVEVGFLAFATLWSLTLPLKDSLTLWDSLVLVGIFTAYAWRLSKMKATEPHLMGVSEWVGSKQPRPRRTWVIGLFVVAAIVILLAAEHFAESLVSTGTSIGVSEFLLVQWVAPLASESPELIVACLYAWRLNASDSLGTLLSSKVNQWTLLVGGLPIVFAMSSMTLTGLPLDSEQRYELLITGAQSLFAISLLLDLRLTVRGASALLGLFLVQFFVSVLLSSEANEMTIIALSIVYGAAAVAGFVRHARRTARVVRDATVTSFDRLPDEPEAA